ncbi:MAG TPA: PAS domain S-box protein, partial [Verrucomicrobiae bacterium]|nr:PAS domain S-box protein [Verrucomicrobiae bacterium]
MRKNQKIVWGHYAVAMALITTAYLIHKGLTWALGEAPCPYMTLYPAVMFAALIGGLGPGLVATGLVSFATVFIGPTWHGPLSRLDHTHVVATVFFLATGTLLSYICQRYHLMRERMEEMVRQRTAELEKSRQAALNSAAEAAEARRNEEQAGARLRAREQQLRLFVEYTPAAIAMLDTEMRYLAVSRRWMTDYKLKQSDIVGRSHYEIFPEIPERWKAVHRRCLAGAVERCEADPFPRANGGMDWVRWEIRPWRNDEDAIGGLMLFSELITDRKTAEEALQLSEHRLSLATTVARQGVWDWDIARDETYFSSLYYEMTGYKHGEVRTDLEFFRSLVEPEDWPNVLGTMQTHLRGETESSALEYRMRRKSGELSWIRGIGKVVARDEKGAPLRMVGVVMDITEKKLAEQNLRRSEQSYREIFNATSDAIFLHDAVTGRVLDV